MTERRYEQRCPIAQALDLVGERWALLIVRELVLGPARFGQLLDALPAMGTKVLTARLKELGAHGVIQSTTSGYALTERGAALGPVVASLAAWGQPLLAHARPEDVTVPSTIALMLWARLQESSLDEVPPVQVRIDDRCFVASVVGGEAHVVRGQTSDSANGLALSVEGALELLSGEVGVRSAIAKGSLRLQGVSSRRVRELFGFRDTP